MEAISRSCLPAAAARTKRQRKATCCGVLGAASHRTTCSRSSAAKLTSGLLLAMRTYISYWPQYVYLFMIHTTSTKYSNLTQINKNNVSMLTLVWTWKTGEKELKQFGTHPGTFENTPLMIDNVLYVTTAYNQVAALKVTSLW